MQFGNPFEINYDSRCVGGLIHRVFLIWLFVQCFVFAENCVLELGKGQEPINFVLLFVVATDLPSPCAKI